jgi:predicted esterase
MRYFFTIGIIFWFFAAEGQFFNSVSGVSIPNTPYTSYISHEAVGNDEAGLIIFLHGLGPAINGFTNILSSVEGMPYAMEQGVFDDYADDYYVIAPHYFTGDITVEWNPVEVHAFVNYMINKFNTDPSNPSVDPNKIIMVGFSMGGKGAWDYGQLYYNELAGLMPMWGSLKENGVVGNWCAMKDLPIWSINGEMDTFFPVDGITAVSKRVGVNLFENDFRECATEVPYNKTLITGRPHFGWNEVFNLSSGYNIYEWMTSLDRSITNSANPSYIPEVNLGPDRVLAPSENQWVIHSQVLDYLNRPLTISWEVNKQSQTLAQTSFEEDEDVIIIRNLSPGVYNVNLTVSNGIASNQDQMTITVLDVATHNAPPYFGRKIGGFRMRISSGNIIEINNDDRILTDHIVNDQTNGFNIYADPVNVSFGNIQSELDNNYYYNKAGALNFDYEDGNGREDRLGLYKSGTRRETYTVNLYQFLTFPDEFYLLSSQVSLLFTDDPDFLPITLLSFSGQAQEDGINIQWTTTEEIDNSHFELFRGPSREELVRVGDIAKAAPGNLYNYYHFLDREATSGTHYYQLHSVDLDGTRQLSDIIRVDFTPEKTLVTYPNPALDGQFIIRYPDEDYQQPALFNSHGQQVAFDLEPASGNGEHKITIRDPKPGVYLLQLMDKGRAYSVKVMVE